MRLGGNEGDVCVWRLLQVAAHQDLALEGQRSRSGGKTCFFCAKKADVWAT